MQLKGKEILTIEDAMNLLPEAELAHAKRVALYTEAAFHRAASKGLYDNELKGSNELVMENKQFAYQSALYHDLGKLLDDDSLTERKDHGAKGAYLVAKLYPDFKHLKSYHQRMLQEGALDHHENYDGSGEPEGKSVRQIGYMGRAVAIANWIDHKAMVTRSEDPIGDALKALKAEISTGKFDENFVKCFTASAANLRKAFSENSEGSLAISTAETWIKRRESRPMELRYKKAQNRKSKKDIFVAEMRIRASKGEYTPYDDMKKMIATRKLEPQLGEYFVYELLDALKRFECCRVPVEGAAILLPDGWYTQNKLAAKLEQAFTDEAKSFDTISFLIPEALEKKPSKTFTKNLDECKKLGFSFLTKAEAEKTIKYLSDELLDENQIAEAAIQESEANA